MTSLDSQPNSFSPILALRVGVVLLVHLFVSCDRQAGGPPGAGMGQQKLEVGVSTITPTKITITQDLPGRTSAFRVAEVRARVSGIVLKRLFQEGAEVKEGEQLYQIDPAPYQAALDSAKATLARAEASLAASRLKAARSKEMLSSKIVSKQDYDDALAAQQSDEADVLAGKAGVDTATINLGYTKIVSPINGRIGTSQVTEGAYVQEGQATLMATVQQLDPMYVDMPQSSREIMRIRRAIETGQIPMDRVGKVRVSLILEDGTEYSEQSVLEFADATVSSTTSSVTLRSVFANPKRGVVYSLLPGLFVKARIYENEKSDAILVPQSAVMRNPKGQPVAYVAGDDGLVQQRVLETSRSIGNQWLVDSGLKAGEQLIVNNLQRLRDGLAVTVVSAAKSDAASDQIPTMSAKPEETTATGK